MHVYVFDNNACVRKKNVSCSSSACSTPAFKHAELIGSDCPKAPHNLQKVDLCVIASSSCREYVEVKGREVRPVAGFSYAELNVSIQATKSICVTQKHLKL